MQNVQQTFPFASILALIFITLKLTGYITWSWLWVLSPIWIPLVVIIFLMVLTVILVLVINK
jgi:hypothetical protein